MAASDNDDVARHGVTDGGQVAENWGADLRARDQPDRQILTAPRSTLHCRRLAVAARKVGLEEAQLCFVRIPDDGDRHSELMSITIPKSCR